VHNQIFMAVTSSGSAELLAASSLVGYDLYKTYHQPARSWAPGGSSSCMALMISTELNVVLFADSRDQLLVAGRAVLSPQLLWHDHADVCMLLSGSGAVHAHAMRTAASSGNALLLRCSKWPGIACC